MDERRMPFTAHLRELRKRLLICLAAVAVGFAIAYAFHDDLFAVLKRPVMQSLNDAGLKAEVQQLGFMDLFLVYLKLSLVVGIMAAVPVILYQFWSFVAPGLYRRERRFFTPFLLSGTLAFYSGVVFCYTMVLPLVADFFVSLAAEDSQIAVRLSVETVYSFPVNLLFVFGLVFLLPLVCFLLSLTGIVTYKGLIRFFRVFLVVAFVLGALFTPPDPLSQLLVALPMAALYWIGVLLAYLFGKKPVKEATAAEVAVDQEAEAS